MQRTQNSISEMAAEIEFIDFMSTFLSNGEIHNIADVESIFLNIPRECKEENPEISRKKVKYKFQ